MADLKSKLNQEPEEEKSFWEKIKGAASSLFESEPEETPEEQKKRILATGSELAKKALAEDKAKKEAEKEAKVAEEEQKKAAIPAYRPASPPPKEAAKQRVQNLADMYQLRGNERQALEAAQKDYMTNLEEFKKLREETKDRQATAQMAATLGQAFVQLLAAARGLKTGQDMSGLKFDRQDWEGQQAETNRQLREQLSEIKQKAESDRGLVRAEFREKRAGQEALGREALEQAKELDRQRKEQYNRAEQMMRDAERAAEKAKSAAEKEALQLEADRHATDKNYLLMEMELKPEKQETLEKDDKLLDRLEKSFIQKSNYNPADAKKVFEKIKEESKDTKGWGPWEKEVYDSKKLKEGLQNDRQKWQQFFDKRSKNKKAIPLS